MSVAIRFLDGKILRGSTWEEVERAWNAEFMNAVSDAAEFRTDLQHRAKVWSGLDIVTDGTAKDFLYECERAGLITMLHNADGATDAAPLGKPVSRVIFLDSVRRAAAERVQRAAVRREKS